MTSPYPVCLLDRLLLSFNERGKWAHSVLVIIRAGTNSMERDDAIVNDDPDLGFRGGCAGEELELHVSCEGSKICGTE